VAASRLEAAGVWNVRGLLVHGRKAVHEHGRKCCVFLDGRKQNIVHGVRGGAQQAQGERGLYAENRLVEPFF